MSAPTKTGTRTNDHLTSHEVSDGLMNHPYAPPAQQRAGPREPGSGREATPKRSWGVKDVAGPPNGTRRRRDAAGRRNVGRSQNRRRERKAVLVADFPRASGRRRKRISMPAALRAGAGRRRLATSAVFLRNARLFRHSVSRRVGMAAPKRMARAQHHVVAATGHRGCRKQCSANGHCEQNRGERTSAEFGRPIKHVSKAA